MDDKIRPRIFTYLAEVGKEMGCEVYRVGGMPDHVHLAVQCPRTLCVSDLVRKVKATSSTWIKKQGGTYTGFSWQSGYGVFSLGVSQLKMLTDYIDHQEQHHRRKGFQEEFRDFLAKYAVEYDEKYVWD